uniref:Uncharacterized protein n=1 Tax=Cacopsylla melanoneura TaxID=428564 RepID=A0A8D8ULY1_9HEMI
MVGRAESIRIFRGMNLFDQVWVRAFFSGVFLSCLKTGNYRPPSPYPREAKVKFAWVLQVEYGVVGPVPGLQVERYPYLNRPDEYNTHKVFLAVPQAQVYLTKDRPDLLN